MLTIEKYPKGNHSILPQIRCPNDCRKRTPGSNLRLAPPESGTPAITHKTHCNSACRGAHVHRNAAADARIALSAGSGEEPRKRCAAGFLGRPTRTPHKPCDARGTRTRITCQIPPERTHPLNTERRQNHTQKRAARAPPNARHKARSLTPPKRTFHHTPDTKKNTIHRHHKTKPSSSSGLDWRREASTTRTTVLAPCAYPATPRSQLSQLLPCAALLGEGR